MEPSHVDTYVYNILMYITNLFVMHHLSYAVVLLTVCCDRTIISEYK